jgi:hypothetical protein
MQRDPTIPATLPRGNPLTWGHAEAKRLGIPARLPTPHGARRGPFPDPKAIAAHKLRFERGYGWDKSEPELA